MRISCSWSFLTSSFIVSRYMAMSSKSNVGPHFNEWKNIPSMDYGILFIDYRILKSWESCKCLDLSVYVLQDCLPFTKLLHFNMYGSRVSHLEYYIIWSFFMKILFYLVEFFLDHISNINLKQLIHIYCTFISWIPFLVAIWQISSFVHNLL